MRRYNINPSKLNLLKNRRNFIKTIPQIANALLLLSKSSMGLSGSSVLRLICGNFTISDSYYL